MHSSKIYYDKKGNIILYKFNTPDSEYFFIPTKNDKDYIVNTNLINLFFEENNLVPDLFVKQVIYSIEEADKEYTKHFMLGRNIQDNFFFFIYFTNCAFGLKPYTELTIGLDNILATKDINYYRAASLDEDEIIVNPDYYGLPPKNIQIFEENGIKLLNKLKSEYINKNMYNGEYNLMED